MVKRKVSLGAGQTAARAQLREGAAAPSNEVLDLFFNTGIIHHEVVLGAPLPDVVSGFIVVKEAAAGAPDPAYAVRRAAEGEDPDVEISPLEHFHELSNRWLPIPYQLSSPHAVQVYLSGEQSRSPRIMLAIDTLERPGAAGRCLDANLDADRPFRPLDRNECAAFLDHPETRDLLRKMERASIDRAPFKLAALIETLGPFLPRLRLSRVEDHQPVPVSMVLDFGNSRSAAVLVENRDKGPSGAASGGSEVFAIPLEVRNSSNPFQLSEETFDSRVTFLPAPFDKTVFPLAVHESFAAPSIARLGREALDRALETPHRYVCTLSSPKRYLWDARSTDERWHFATKVHDEFKPIFGRILKYIPEDGDGLTLRQDGPITPADPRYASRSMMLFALVEILSQAYGQINSVRYRAFQGKEQNPRILQHLVLTYPSAMRDEEKQVYDLLVRNAVLLTCYLLNIREEHRPNWNATTKAFAPFLFVDEALAAQMVYVYQEIAESFSGSMEELVQVYGRAKPGADANANATPKDSAARAPATLRIASIDIGGGTSDVMIADYEDRLPGAGTSLAIQKLFQDGISIAGDEVCRAILEDIVFAQILSQAGATPSSRRRLVQLFGEGDAGHGASWRTLKAKLVPYFWLPLARCYWALAEGFEIPDHTHDKTYSVADVFRIFDDTTFSSTVVAEADRFLGSVLKDFPGLDNLFLRFDREEVDRAIESVLREPLRKYADIIAQFDVDLLILAGRTSALPYIQRLLASELPVAKARIKTMSHYHVGDWYPSKWQNAGLIKDPKSTVTAGATVLHLASRNLLPGFLLDEIAETGQRPIYGLYQESEPHITRDNELFRDGKVSPPHVYTRGMTIGFRNVDSEEMDASPLFEIRPRDAEVEAALLEDRVSLRFALGAQGQIEIAEVTSQKNVYSFGKEDFVVQLKTVTTDRYWLDTGVFKGLAKYI